MEDTVTIRDAAKLLGVSEATLRRWDKAGKLRAHRHPMNDYRLYSTRTLVRLKRMMSPGAINRAR
jgi:site-specific DNA-methyltransferase (adenine-specific)